MSLEQLVKRQNVSEEIKDINETLLKECLEQRKSFTPELMRSGNNFKVTSKHTNYLYNLFY